MTEELSIVLLNTNAQLFYPVNNIEQINRGDSGYDLYYCDDTITIQPFQTVMIGLGIMAELTLSDGVHGYDLMPRSSIYKTPLQMANSIGLIDYGYRGEIKACVRNLSSKEYTIMPGTKLFQLVMPNRKPFAVKVVETLNKTIRGEDGFGSTDIINIV